MRARELCSLAIQHKKGEEMKISKTLKKVIKTEGKSSPVSRKVIALRSSKEFNYLIDTVTS